MVDEGNRRSYSTLLDIHIIYFFLWENSYPANAEPNHPKIVKRWIFGSSIYDGTNIQVS